MGHECVIKTAVSLIPGITKFWKSAGYVNHSETKMSEAPSIHNKIDHPTLGTPCMKWTF